MNNKYYFREETLLTYIINAYYHYINYKLNNNKQSLQTYKKMKIGIKHLTKLTMNEINEIFYATNISNKTISCLFHQFKTWL